MVELRAYQSEAVQATRAGWAAGMRRVAIVLPTGTGKTTVFSKIEGDMAAAGIVSLVVAHRDELIEQAAERARLMNPTLRVGIVKGPREEIRGRNIIVGSIQTLGRSGAIGQRRRDALRRAGVRLVIVDECHHAVADSYMRLLRDLGCFDPVPADGSLSGAYALGVTATMTRTDRLALGQVWEDVVYRKDILSSIREGYLTPVRGLRVRVAGLDLTRVKRTAGDFRQGELAEALHDALAPKAITRAYLEHAAGRPAVAFTPSVDLAYELAQAMRDEGIAAEAFDGKTPMDDRRGVLRRLRSGELQVVVNCGVLTEGFDEPRIECVIIARPTQSAGLYVQMAGRGLRPSPWTGKRDCLLMDVVGVTGKHRLAGLVDLAGVERNEELPDELAIYDELPEEEPVDLLDLMDPASALRRARPAPVEGPIVVESVDLFEDSRAVWLRTRRGVWFLEVPGERIVFLAPDTRPGEFAVCETGVHDTSGRYLHRHLDLQTAMLRGEAEASRIMGGVLIRKSAGWRRQSPTSGQNAKAVRLGVELQREDGEYKTKGEVSDEIAVIKAGARLDHMGLVSTVSVDGYWPTPDHGQRGEASAQ